MRRLTALLTLLFCQTLHAGDYKIEVLIFSRDNVATSAENWQSADTPAPAPGISLPNGAYQPLGRNSFFLNTTEQRLHNAAGIRVLYHGAWRQPVVSGRASRAVQIEAGQLAGSGQPELQGTITVDRGRFLHFKPDLQLRRAVTQADGTQTVLTTRLTDLRPMKSKESHYIDHPLFGILVYTSAL